MFTEHTYQMMKDYTIQKLNDYTTRFLNEKNKTLYTEIPDLFAQDVFEEGCDLFINLHLPEANTKPGHLHGHDFFELTYIIKGTCLQNIDHEDPITLEEGALCIMNPNARHSLYLENEDSIVLNILMKTSMFNTTFWPLIQENEYIGSFFLSYFLSQSASSNYLIYHTQNPPSIQAMMNHMCEEYLERKLYYKSSLRCIMLLFFTEVIRDSAMQFNKKPFTNKVSVQIAALFNYLSVNYPTATLASTAEYFHYHPNYLSAFVKKHTGKTFRSILDDIKLSYANYYLTSTNLSISEISERLGFQQLCNFYDFIRKHYGMTPGDYRKKNNSFL
ncbi:MAG: AraC family transcriptional regulator [Bariatricus sp.]